MTSHTMVPTFAALGDATRWNVLVTLSEGDSTASAIAERMPVSRQAITKHLAVLHEVGLVDRVRVGREVRYRALGSRLTEMADALAQVGVAWERRLATIKQIAEDA